MNQLSRSGIVLFFFLILSAASQVMAIPAPVRELYEIRIYHIQSIDQEKQIDYYLQNALIPALHNHGIKKIGVFKPLTNDTAKNKKVFVLIPFRSPADILRINEKLSKDSKYLGQAKEYMDAAHNSPPYARFESILLQAFTDMPQLRSPQLTTDKKDRIYELRSYEGATEKLSRNKIDMFNKGGEIKLFERLGFNAIFYGEVLFGSQRPNLMYMTSFENMSSRNEHWNTFRVDPEWKNLSSMEIYKNNVLRGDTYLMQATEYSDL